MSSPLDDEISKLDEGEAALIRAGSVVFDALPKKAQKEIMDNLPLKDRNNVVRSIKAGRRMIRQSKGGK